MPQTARHQGNALLIYAKGKMLVSGGIRSSSLQFEDDLNTFVMPGYSTIQFLVKRRLGHGVSGMVAVENILNRSYIAGFTPEATTGTPRLLRVGLKWESGS
jgi:outer membrane receptor for ferric coprogen and ferric-rhodotorulic acid